MRQLREIISLFLSIFMILGYLYNVQIMQEDLPEFHESRTFNEQTIRDGDNPIKETAIVQKSSSRQLTIGQKNQNKLTLIKIICLMISVAFIWKCQTLIFALVWYALEQYRKYICRVSVRRGPPV